MAEKKVIDYSNSAVNLCNPPDIATKLIDLHVAQNQMKLLEEALAENENFREMKRYEQMVADMTAFLRVMIDKLGSYQDLERGYYAVKSIRKSKQYHAQPFIENYPKYAPAVIEQSINVKALEGLVKGNLLTEAELASAGVITTTESYAYIIK